MKNSLNTLKLFLLDWLLTFVMFVVGTLVSLLGFEWYADFIQYVDLVKTGVEKEPVFNTFIYLLTSISMVILFSALINKSWIKVPWKSFVYAQILYILSIALIILLLPIFI